MKSYRRNWMMGMALVVASVLVYLISSPGTVKTVALYVIGVGLILAGWSGSVWMEKEKLSKKT
jgi:hypothetical protein